ncbi:LINE-1 retrotransposable element ORF2 protein [Stylophora pistillata]|uniref:LINE-1 retrotransposable element ORF2 protein n=1 Tax=Stylophora pistillata TaxID=50429 RepID=A0A2B4RPF0_STYPI|nr:LINE-1 retrotransposable element ORF2 protein [Stylophora pistillata]
MQDDWYSRQADTIQGYADIKDIKNFYTAIKAVYGPTISSSPPLLSADGKTLISDKGKILERWAEHFHSVLNRPSNINEEAIDRLPQVPINNTLTDPPTEAEVAKAIKRLSSGKAPGADSIPAEVYAAGGPKLIECLTSLFATIWTQEKLPQELKDASIIHLYKRKGSSNSCDNHRGISLLSIAGKILARIMLNRLNAHLEHDVLPETFDTVCREGLWKIMAKFRYPAKFNAMVRQFDDGMYARVQDDGECSKPFPVTNGVKQGCVLAPTLFSMVFSAMLSDAFRDVDVGVRFRYRTDGSLFNLRRLQAKNKGRVDTARDFLFADDCALNTSTESDMQENMDLFTQACDDFSLTISTKKTEVMHQPAPATAYTEPIITVNGQRLAVADKFVYLGSNLSTSTRRWPTQ